MVKDNKKSPEDMTVQELVAEIGLLHSILQRKVLPAPVRYTPWFDRSDRGYFPW